MFKKMLLDALEKSPPRSVDDLAVFFERSRGRLIQSLDKGQVSGDERERYLAEFQSSLNEAQVDFLNDALARDNPPNKARGDGLASAPLDSIRMALKQPVILGLFILILLVGIALGVLLAP